MTFDFVVETPHRRGINRNNNKIIQKRATQAGARTRLGDRLKQKSADADNSSITLPSRPTKDKIPNEDVVLANARLAAYANSPFLGRFGAVGQMLYVHHLGFPPSNTCFHLPDPTLSVLQRKLLIRLATHPISKDANRLFKIMMLTQRQFLEHFPAHYGELPFLDEAIECLVARLHDIVPLLKPRTNNSSVRERVSPTVLYGKALTSLRAAIDNELSRNLSYIWFAIILLTLFELLSMGDEPGWIWHAAGSARMLYKVGPENIQSEFHMSLLCLQWRIMVMETIFNNKPCYLADPRWQEAIQRTILNTADFSDRSRVSTELWLIAAKIPNLFQSVSDHVHGQMTADSISPKIASQHVVDAINGWEQEWRDMLENTCRNVLRENTIRHQSLMILLAFYVLSLMTHRLCIAIEPIEKIELESEVLALSTGVVFLRREFMSCRWSAEHKGFIYVKVASATRTTAAIWKAEIEAGQPDMPINAVVFNDWCSAIGRVVRCGPSHATIP